MHKYVLVGLVGIVAGVLFTSAVMVLAGTTDSPAAPGSTKSYTLEDIYNRLDDGTTVISDTFQEPVTGPPTDTMHTLNEIMDKAPAVDNTDGVTTANVANGKTFWGLNVTAGEWGLQTGERYGGCTCSGTLVGTRWCHNGDGTVTDLLGSGGKGKCLVWLKKADWGGTKAWAVCDKSDYDAHTQASILEAAGYECLSDGSVEGDWRLPTLSELKALTTGTEAVSSQNMRAFTGVQSDYYWSSTSRLVGAWAVSLYDGSVPNIPIDRAFPLYVWPVRGGQ